MLKTLCLRLPRSIAALVLTLSASVPATADGGREVPALPDLARQAAVETLDFDEDDLISLTDARHYFTQAGWAAFLRSLTGFVNADGAPSYSSRFTPTGDMRSTNPDAAHVHIAIAGTLEQSRAKPPRGRTTYRAVVDVTLRRDTGKLDALTTRTCGGARTARSCL